MLASPIDGCIVLCEPSLIDKVPPSGEIFSIEYVDDAVRDNRLPVQLSFISVHPSNSASKFLDAYKLVVPKKAAKPKSSTTSSDAPKHRIKYTDEVKCHCLCSHRCAVNLCVGMLLYVDMYVHSWLCLIDRDVG